MPRTATRLDVLGSLAFGRIIDLEPSVVKDDNGQPLYSTVLLESP
jgi:hypothetical protein